MVPIEMLSFYPQSISAMCKGIKETPNWLVENELQWVGMMPQETRAKSGFGTIST